MTNQELLNTLLNDPEVKELLAKLNRNESLDAALKINEINSLENASNFNSNGCHPYPNHKKCNNDWGIGIALLLLLFCCCGCGGWGGGFFCC